MAAAPIPPDDDRSSQQTRIDAFWEALTDIRRLPRGFWLIVAVFAIESMAYFGVLTLMVTYLTRDLHWDTGWAALTVSIFTGLVTLFMLGAGSYAESFGLRRAIIAALILCIVGRVAYCYASGAPADVVAPLLLVALLVIAVGEAILQPVCYSGVKQYTDARTGSMGYGLIYAIMNAGIVVIGEISARFRPGVQAVIDARNGNPAAGVVTTATQAVAASQSAPAAAAPQLPEGITGGISRWLAQYVGSGVQAINWICVGLTALTLLGFLLFMTRRVESNKLRPDRAEQMRMGDNRTWDQRLVDYFGNGPFANPRFIFFIFMLLPVRTLFAHQWLTMPEYILRAYDQDVADNMERLVNWINPAIIFFGVPIATAMTRRVNVYTMMIVGSLVSAAPTFLLCAGANLQLLITYMVIFSIGEALWSARFLEYASELAPEGRIAQYMGLANIPWLLAKFTTGLYSGYLLDQYCPSGPHVDQNPEALWFIYGCIAMASPIGLWLARSWVMKGLHAKTGAPSAAA